MTNRPASRSPWRVVAGAAASFVVAAGVGVVAFAVFGDDSTPNESGPPTISDGFERADGADLVGSDSDREWEEVTGTFGVTDGHALVSQEPSNGSPSIVVIDVGATNARLAVKAGRMADGWGIVFRYVDPFNYWFVQAVPRYAVFNLVRVSAGVAEQMGKSTLAATVDGAMMELTLRGAIIELDVNGQLVLSATNEHALGATEAGLIAYGPEAIDATWDSFVADADGDDPGPTEVVLVPPRSSPPSTSSSTTAAPSATSAPGGVVPG